MLLYREYNDCQVKAQGIWDLNTEPFNREPNFMTTWPWRYYTITTIKMIKRRRRQQQQQQQQQQQKQQQ